VRQAGRAVTSTHSPEPRRVRALFFESGRRGGSVNRLKSILERLDPDRVEGGFLTWYHDFGAARLFGIDRMFCRRSLGLRGEQPDSFKHPGGMTIPTPFALYYLLASLRVIRRYRPDLVYANSGLGEHAAAILAASRAGVPVVCHLRQSDPLNRDDLRAARRVARFVTSSRWGARFFQGQLRRPAEAFDCVYEGIDLPTFDAQVREGTPPPLPPGPVYIVLVGSLIARKRPLLAIEALALAHRRRRELRLVIAGDGPLRTEVDRFVRRAGLEPLVVRLGRITAVPALLRQCHIGLLVSESEGMPNAVMEYMAGGLPVVSSAVPGVEELLDHGRTGLIVPDPIRPEAVAEALVAIAADPDQRASFGHAGRARIEDDVFRVETEAKGVAEVLFKAVGSLASSPAFRPE
jgi:glycosyltransferase involved in cell wall biosynthesis